MKLTDKANVSLLIYTTLVEGRVNGQRIGPETNDGDLEMFKLHFMKLTKNHNILQIRKHFDNYI